MLIINIASDKTVEHKIGKYEVVLFTDQKNSVGSVAKLIYIMILQVYIAAL